MLGVGKRRALVGTKNRYIRMILIGKAYFLVLLGFALDSFELSRLRILVLTIFDKTSLILATFR